MSWRMRRWARMWPALQIAQPGDLGGDGGRLQQQRLAGGQRLDLGVGQGGGVDVLDLAGRQLAGEDLGDEPRLALQRLPHVAVEGALGDIPDDPHAPVVVARAQAAALALFHVGGPPGGVDVVDGDAAVLDVGAHPELVGAAEQDRYPPGPAVGEQRRLGGVGPGLVHPADPVGGDPGGDQAAAQLAVDLRAGGCGWACPGRRRRPAARRARARGRRPCRDSGCRRSPARWPLPARRPRRPCRGRRRRSRPAPGPGRRGGRRCRPPACCRRGGRPRRRGWRRPARPAWPRRRAARARRARPRCRTRRPGWPARGCRGCGCRRPRPAGCAARGRW